MISDASSEKMNSYGECLAWGRDYLKRAGVREHELDARILLEESFEISGALLLAHLEDSVHAEAKELYIRRIHERGSRIPLQHILGYTEFMGLAFEVNGDVLVPRQDTEILVEEVLRNIHDGMDILDLCTGSGCILTSLLYYSNDCNGVGSDISGRALAIAAQNADALLKQKENVTYEFVESDMFEKLYGRSFDIVVSNPPYIETAVIPTLDEEVRVYDPTEALDGGADGLDFYRNIAVNAQKVLRPGGKLFLEIGCEQAEEVSRLLSDNGYINVKIIKDYAGHDRVVSAGRKICLTN